MTRQSASPTVEMLTAIWQRVLQRPALGVNDHFFRAGGGPYLADRLFEAIAQEYGRELPSAAIYRAPTIAQLAFLLEQPSLPPFSPFVQVKDGSTQPSIFIVHGLAGTVPFFELANCMATDDHPVYGIQAQGVDGLEQPLDRVEQMAALYLRTIRQVQPRGPYLLIGYSFGGLVALEMAESMLEVGEQIALLALIDAYPDPHYLLSSQRLRLGVQRTWNRLSQMRRKSPSDGMSYIIRGLKRRLHIEDVHDSANPAPGASPLSLEYTTSLVKGKAYVALAHYRPRAYSGKIKFVKSQSDSYFPANPTAVWSNLAKQFEFETVPGGHLDMVTGEAKDLADVLTRYVQQSFHEL